jgi:tRNA dimethylallyltransferase
MHLLVIAGPTASGKTAIAAAVAHALGVPVLSADSRQVYRGLDLGTGKDLDEFRKYVPPVPYHLIDIADPNEVYTLFQYQSDCYRIVETLARGGSEAAVMAGGTGMYLEAILRRYRIANVPENEALRRESEGRSREDLEAELRNRDPQLAARTDMSSKKRIVRALVISEAGRAGPIEHSPLPGVEFTHSVFATRPERRALRARIDARLEERLGAGMVEEVEGLLGSGVAPDRLRLLGMEYREITSYLAGEKTRERMIEDLRHEIHMLAKRQETYFRGMEKRGVPVTWLEPGQGAEFILEQRKKRESRNV